jgi:DNA-binding LacI/PurR family transcriptional regulator
MIRNIIEHRTRPTIYSVAVEAGVSISTVSRFLNTPQKVNEETARRIQSAIKQLDYVPHGHVGLRVHRDLRRIGVLSPFFTAPSFVMRMQGMNEAFREANCEMVVCAVDSPEQLSGYLHSVSFLRRFDGLILMSMTISDADACRLAGSGLHVVTIESPNPLFSNVDVDNVLGGRVAAQCFLQKGYLPCAFLGEYAPPSFSPRPSETRLAGFLQALEESGHVLAPEMMRTGRPTQEDASQMAGELLDLPHPPRAIFAMSDLMAIGVLRAARQRGFAVPGRLAVLGFDDIEAAAWTGLSTVGQSLLESGRVAARLLIERITHDDLPLQRVHLEVRLIERDTT